MINIVFDLSNMFHRSMYIVGGFGKKGYTFDNQDEIDQLIRKVATDVSFTLRQVNPSRVIFALDSRSWRKEIEIEENEGYKGNRKKADHLNWTNIYQAMDDFCSIVNKKGLIITKIERAEADDIMCLWRDELLFNQSQHVVLVSGDEDIRQLVAFNPIEPGKLVFSTVFNPFTQGRNASKKLFAGSQFKKWLEDDDDVGDIFNRDSDPEKSSFLSLVNENQVKFEEIDGEEIALRKVFCGDDGDNVPAIYTWKGTTSTGNAKEYRITESKYQKIIEAIRPQNITKQVDYLDLSDHENLIFKQLYDISGKTPPFEVGERLKRQIKLVVLSRYVFPKDIVKEFDKEVSANLDIKPTLINGWYMNSLLEGSRYIDEGYKNKKNESSIFKEIDKISQQLF